MFYFQINNSKLTLDGVDIELIKKEIDKKLVKFFYACNIPYRIVEDEFFLDLVNSLCQINFKYKPPCRQLLASGFLKDVHEDITLERKQMFEGTQSVLLVDEWRNKTVNRKFIVCTMRNINVPQAFLSYRDASLENKDGETLAQIIQEAIEIAKKKYKTNIFSIVTDSDSKIICGGRLAETYDDENLWQSTCSSHSANLLIKNLVDDSLVEKLRNVIHTFRDPKLDTLVQRFGGTELENFPDTRFFFIKDTCESVLKNLHILREISLIEDVHINESITGIIFDENFETELTWTIEVVTPICKLINKCQDPLYNVADSTELWLSLQLPTNEHNEQIEAIIKKAIWPVGYAANLLHPKYKGLLLDRDQTEITYNFLEENLDEQGKLELEKYSSDTALSLLSEKCSNAISFWSLCEFKYPNLSKIATKLMLMPASTALIEDLFSTWTYIHNTYRSSLKNENSNKLVDIYHTLRCLKGNKKRTSRTHFNYDDFL